MKIATLPTQRRRSCLRTVPQHCLFCLFSFFFLTSVSAFALPPLQEAAREGKIDEVHRLIAEDPKRLTKYDEDGNQAIHWAVAHGRTPVVEYLLKLGVSPNTPKSDAATKHGQKGWTALHQAAAGGQVEVLQLLLRYPVNLDAREQNDQTPLHTAVWHNQIETARLLIEAGTPVNIRRKDGVFPLEIASFFGYTDMVKMLIGKGADVNGQVYEGNAPLHQAARNDHWVVMQTLIQAGAEINMRRKDEQTLLHVAAASGRGLATQFLLSIGADTTALMKDNLTPLAHAQRSGQGGTAALIQAFLAAVEDTKAKIAAREAHNRSLTDNPKAMEKVVYKNEFTEETVGEEWSSTPTGAHHAPLQTTQIPGTGKRVLGEFGDQKVRLTLAKLPPHSQVTVVLTLCVINTWDGNLFGGPDLWDGNLFGGPDLWEASVTDGPLLLRTTFANCAEEWNKVPYQAFPGEWPLTFHIGRTDAIARDVLKLGATSQNPKGKPDTLYRIKWTFAHDKPFLLLNFEGKNLQEIADESWAIRNIEVRVKK